MLKIGSHVSLKEPDMYLGSVLEALSYNANCLMVYTGAPQNSLRKPLNTMKIDEALKFMKQNDFDKRDIVVHAPYIINLANPDPEKRNFGIEFLTKEIIRSAKMNAYQIVLHPGSAVGGNLDEAIRYIAESINIVLEKTKDLDVMIALETMSGKGTEVGKTFEELKQIIDLIDNKKRISVCFDTCHTDDYGYDIKNDFRGVIKHFDEVIGKEYISVFHINDSKNSRGAKKDRHANIGFGELGFEALIDVIYDPDFKDIPKILETPYYEGKPPYKFEIQMIRNKVFDPDLLKKIKNS